MEQERIWLLLGRKVSGEATMAELRELEELLVQYPAERYQFAVLSSWQPVSQEEWRQKTDVALEKHLARMQEEFPQDMPAPVKKKRRSGMIAVVSLLVVMTGGISTWLFSGKNKTAAPVETAEIQTRNGSRSKAILPDGTEVWLNGGSRLTYNPAMNTSRQREIMLSGEAFFNVTKNADRPFIIHTSNMQVKVLGTTFNIKAYPTDRQTETSLITGAVEVWFNKNGSQKVQLEPNQKITVLSPEHNVNASPEYSITHIRRNEQGNIINETAWCDNFLIFDNEGFRDVALKMERWFGVKIHLKDKKLMTYRFTGTFKNESLPEILEALKVTSSFRCRIAGNEVFINQ
ncbi:FecR family protein [Chitinophaga solisilvae]|uniref:FecR family protein n=1 Tax=Chitinophaga solisilvae TaxID=1233460 RepID=UPI001369CD5A|nr:FecR family protein [Chitinophaga solisilvae]